MKYSFSSLLAIAAYIASTNAHINLKSPVPFRSDTGPPQNAPSKDFDMKAPLLPSGANFPCKLYHKDSQGTQPLATWAAGSTQTMEFDGSAVHGGGSCQASISEDGGTSFKVIKSFIGGCPEKPESFVVPKEAKSGPVIFAWSWFNNLGVREMYMNCAAVTITGGGSGLSGAAFPDIFKANIGNGCETVASRDVAFPNPGPNVEGSGGAPPTGNCGSGGGSPAPVVSPSPSPVGAPTSVPVSVPTSTSTTALPPAATTPPTYPGPGYGNPAPIAPTPGTTTTSQGTPAPSLAPNNTSPGPACVEGSVICNSDGTWSQCGSGYLQNMGKIAQGMVCTDGRIHSIDRRRALRFSREHIARRHSYGSR